jgi:hypothetical protein
MYTCVVGHVLYHVHVSEPGQAAHGREGRGASAHLKRVRSLRAAFGHSDVRVGQVAVACVRVRHCGAATALHGTDFFFSGFLTHDGHRTRQRCRRHEFTA